jgi:predicted DNA-binding antitoxin AbrB/MazE fold protein
MATITAVFENGVFRPLQPVQLPEHTRVEFEPKVQTAAVDKADTAEPLAKVYDVLSRRFRSGHHDTAERHNEHQP